MKRRDGKAREGLELNCAPNRMNVRGLSAPEVFDLTVAEVEKLLAALPMLGGYSSRHLAALIVEAAAREVSLNQASKDLDATMAESTARHHLKKLQIDELVARTNQLLAACFPVLPDRPIEVAGDITDIAYHGSPDNARMHDFVRRGKAKQGTNNFLSFASLYVMLDHRRFTLALLPVKRGEKVADILERLIQIARQGGVRMRLLFLDRGFYSVEVVARLQALGQPYCIMARTTGKEGGKGTRALCRGKTRSVRWVRESKSGGEVASKLHIVRKWQKGRMGKHGAKHFLYLTWRCPVSIKKIYEAYRRRFGIESSYRQKDDARIRTATRYPARRFLFAAVGFLMLNLWVQLKWTRVSRKRRGPGGRTVIEELFPFETMLVFMTVVCGERYGRVREVIVTERG